MNLGKPYSNGLKQFEKIPDSELLCYKATPLDFIPDRNAEDNAKEKVGESCSHRKRKWFSADYACTGCRFFKLAMIST